mmetsp:Transcript_900/g.2763  ORF Transcript_900/g.2763 Transcript_900/m.2763 type:complete len:404 (-) Transcript_900:251-1462(-)
MFARYITSVSRAISSQDGAQLRELLHINNPDASAAVHEARQMNRQWNPEKPCQRLPQPWSVCVAAHARCMADMQAGEAGEAYNAILAAVQPFIKAFQEDQTAWMVVPIGGFARTLRAVADAADEELKRQGKQPEKLADCLDRLRKLFQAAQQAAGNKAKRMATLDLINVQFKMFFQLGNIRLCASLERAVKSPAFLPLSSFPAAQLITYNYYIGRLAIFDEDYNTAVEVLTDALRRCPPGAHGNRCKLLKYLVPTQLLLGRMPRGDLLQRHGLQQYEPIAYAMRTGEVGLLESTLEANQHRFIHEGMYLLVEKLKYATYRRLMKRVQLLHAESNPGKGFQLPLVLVERALTWQQSEVEADEVECVVANLIARKYVKGYISHKAQVVVLSKVQPFPPLRQVDLK